MTYSPAFLPSIALLYEPSATIATSVAQPAPLPHIGLMFVAGTATVSRGGAPGRRRRRKLWLLETDSETLVFDSETEREQYVTEILEPRARAAKRAAQVTRRVIKTRVPKEELRAKVPRPTFPDPVPTDALIEARMQELESELKKSRELWEKQLDLEDEELLWLL